ncbi:hypothetical protein [Acetobacterium sp. K1/6]|uniref:hypothetical protein n=1 Tax=Acetobacterium sp. K1/6 TaxID=3055467 RepID=UPI002ACAB7CF|nr:hypothetical protein [Acetobacterium sp. K1/6]MDZ5726181.1 hypothetical protein [Acetobacterium sp. K1/6]
MNEIENLEKQLKDLEQELMREECYTMLTDYIFYFNLDKKKELQWTKDENVLVMMDQIKQVVDAEKNKLSKYYEIKSEYSHANGGSAHGHSHSHGNSHNHHEHS